MLQPPDFLRLLLLSAIWGASFLFMRIAAPSFGPVPLVMVRVVVAAVCLLPWMLGGERPALIRRHVWHLLFVGVIGSAVPFCLLAFAVLRVEGGFASLLNATTPLFTAGIGAIFFGAVLRRSQVLGLALGFIGVTVLVGGKLTFKSGGAGWAVAAGLGAALSYGISAQYAKRRLAGLPSAMMAAGSMWGAALAMVPVAVPLWPGHAPPMKAWGCVLLLGVVCTGAAYLLYFSLLARGGATAASTVTFVVPVFAILWGAIFLKERPEMRTYLGMAITLLGTAFTTGVIADNRQKGG